MKELFLFLSIVSISSITMGQETSITENTTIPIQSINPVDTITSSHLLTEVVVTGHAYSHLKSSSGNAIETKDREMIEKSGSYQVSDVLRGVPGVLVMQNSGNPAGGFSLRLRGASTISGSSDPLYIVDGTIVNNDSKVLLDLGGYSQNRISDILPEDIEKIEIVKGASATAIYGSRASNGVVQIFTKAGRSGKPVYRYSSSIMLNSLRKKVEFNQVPLQWVNTSDITNTETIPATRYDFQDEFFTKALGTEHHLSVQGGTDQTQYYASGSFLNNGGIIKNTSYTKYSGRINLHHAISEKLKVSLHSNYVVSESTDKPNGGMEEGYGAVTGYIFSNNANSPFPDERGIYPPTTDLLPRPNPIEVVDRFDFHQQVNRFIGSIQFNYHFTDKLDLSYLVGIDQYDQQGFAYIPKGNTTSFTEGYANSVSANVSQTNSDLILKYLDQIGSFSTATIVGMNFQYERSENAGIEAKDLTPFIEVTEGGVITDQIDFRSERNLYGIFLQETFGWKEKIHLTLGLRTDASSVFSIDHKWQWYPKANIAYILSNENFWKETGIGRIIPFIKVRAAYGEAGNMTAITPYSQYSKYTPILINGQTGLITSSQSGNDHVYPERQKETEIGFDASFLNSRLGVEFTWYQQSIEGLLLRYAIAPSRGFTSTIGNVGQMTNKGLEIQAKIVILQNDNWNWNTLLNFSKNHNKVSHIPGNRITLSPSFSSSYAINGEALGVFYRQYYARNPDGSVALDVNGYPATAKDENGNVLQKVIGDPNPQWIGSCSSEVSYRNLTFSVFLDAVQGFDVFNWNRRLMDNHLYGGGPNAGKELNGQLPKGYGSRESSIFEAFVEDGSFVKVRELGLTYNFSHPIPNINSLKIGIMARNLFSFDHYSAWDPEINTPGQNNGVRGFDFAEVPIPRTFLMNLTVTF